MHQNSAHINEFQGRDKKARVETGLLQVSQLLG